MRAHTGQYIKNVDLEGKIMAAWGLSEDVRLLVEAALDRDFPMPKVLSMLEGTINMYTLRFLKIEEDYVTIRKALEHKHCNVPTEWEASYVSCQNVLENLQSVLNYYKTTRLNTDQFQDTFSNALLGLETVINMKFEKLFQVYTHLLPNFNAARHSAP